MAPEGAVRAFIDAFNSEDHDALAAVLDPEVEIHASRGLRRGVEEARRWATRAKTGELHQRIELDDVRIADDHAVALIRRQWWWREQGEMAGEDEIAWAFELRDGLIRSWRGYDDRAEALRWAGIER